MPAIAAVGAAVGAEVIGGAIATTAIGAAVGTTVSAAIGGAIGGGLAGGIASEVSGGKFSDGFKNGALGGLVSGGLSGFLGDTGAAASGAGTVDTATGTIGELNPSTGLIPSETTTGSTGLGDNYASSISQPTTTPSSFQSTQSPFGPTNAPTSLQNVISQAGGTGTPSTGLEGSMAAQGAQAGVAPTTGALGTTGSAVTSNSLGSSLGGGSALKDTIQKLIGNNTPETMGRSVFDYLNTATLANNAKQQYQGIQNKYNTAYNNLSTLGTGMIQNAQNSQNATRARINAVLAKYGATR